MAGILALALIVIPVVIRTTENMLTLIPNALREAAYALGTPKWQVIMTITLKAARAGVHHRRAAGAGAHRRRDRAAALHRAVQPVLDQRPRQPMASLPVTIFKFAMSPYENWQKLAWAGVFLITLGRAGAEHPRPHPGAQPDLGRRTNGHPSREGQPAATGSKPKLAVRDLNFYYGGFHALKNINLDIPENKVTAFIGPSGCGKSTLLRTFNRMFELYPEQRAEGRDPARRRRHR